jgi:hypothetical protein
MSYFKIIDDYFVAEFDNDEILNYWYIHDLKKNQDSISKLDRRSFKRAKKWLLKNHPEYIL